jgi:hypothetical protein
MSAGSQWSFLAQTHFTQRRLVSVLASVPSEGYLILEGIENSKFVVRHDIDTLEYKAVADTFLKRFQQALLRFKKSGGRFDGLVKVI